MHRIWHKRFFFSNSFEITTLGVQSRMQTSMKSSTNNFRCRNFFIGEKMSITFRVFQHLHLPSLPEWRDIHWQWASSLNWLSFRSVCPAAIKCKRNHRLPLRSVYPPGHNSSPPRKWYPAIDAKLDTSPIIHDSLQSLPVSNSHLHVENQIFSIWMLNFEKI